MQHKSTILSGILLVSGTCMGAGMLAIPLVTGLAGFIPAMAVNLVCYLFMMATGLLFLEVTLWMPDGANVISMTERFLGTPGKILGGFFFLFLYYCLVVAYIAGGAPLLTSAFENLLQLPIHQTVGFVIYTLIFGFIVLVGAWFVDRSNWILMAGLILSYFLLLGIGIDDVQLSYLSHQNWHLTLLAVSVLFAAYGYHNVIPSLSTYLKRDSHRLRLAIIWGTTIPFVVYSLWQWLIIGSVPLEQLSMAESRGIPASTLLSQVTGNYLVSTLSLYFGFFAIVTSLLGVALSMVDFLGDGLHIKRTGLNRLFLTCAVFIPPLIITLLKPDIFLTALSIAGGIGEAFLNGFLPVIMVWIGRYSMKLSGKEQLLGGKPLLGLLLIITIIMMGTMSWYLI